jgi:hypothetical protein
MAAQLAEVAVIGIDLGKNSCSLAALDGKGAVIKRYRMRPASIATFQKTCRLASSPWKLAAGHIISAVCWQSQSKVTKSG